MDKNGKVDEVWRYVGPKLEMLVTSLEKLDSIKRSFENNDISYDAFLELDDKALKEDLKIDSFGIRKQILTIASDLRRIHSPESHNLSSSRAALSSRERDLESICQVRRRLDSDFSMHTDPSNPMLKAFFDHDQTPAIRDTQRAVAICTYFVKRCLKGILKRLPTHGEESCLELRGTLQEINPQRRSFGDKYQKVKLDMHNLNFFEKSLLEECTNTLPKTVKFHGDGGNIIDVPIFEVLAKSDLVLKFNTRFFEVRPSRDRSSCAVHIPSAPLRGATGDLEDRYDNWNPVQRAFWEVNRCQTVRIFCAGGKTLVQLMDALGLTPHPSGRYDKTLICGNSKASVDNVKKYVQAPSGPRGQSQDFSESCYNASCNLKRLLNIEYDSYKALMKNRIVILGDGSQRQKLDGDRILIASSQRITRASKGKRNGCFDDFFGHIIIDEGDYGFADPDEGGGKGEWKKIRKNNPASFITYYSGTTQNAQGCEIPAPYISISYKDLVLAEHVKTLCFYTLFGPRFRNLLPDGRLWNPREVQQLRTAAERAEADAFRRKILGPALYVSVCRRNPPHCVIHAYIRRALKIWLDNRKNTKIPTQMLVFAPNIGRRNDLSAERVGSKRRSRRAAAAAARRSEPKVETKELVRKLVEVFNNILRNELNAPDVRVGCAISSDGDCEESVERFKRFELDVLINIRVLERSADFPMVDHILDLHSHSTPEFSGRAGAYAAAIQRFTRAARIIDPTDPNIRVHPQYAQFAPALQAIRDRGGAQKMYIFELDLDPRDWILNRFCQEESSLLAFSGCLDASDRSLMEGNWVRRMKDDNSTRQEEVAVEDGGEGVELDRTTTDAFDETGEEAHSSPSVR